MAGVTAQGGTFTFSASDGGQVSAYITDVSVETPTAEVVDMTAIDDAAATMRMVPTGSWSGGSITVGYLHTAGASDDPHDVVRQYGTLSFASAGYTVTRNVLLESATTEARTGDIVRGTLKFRLTDYTG